MKPQTLLLLLLLSGCHSAGYSGSCETGACPDGLVQPCNQPMYCRGLNDWHAACLARLYAKKTLMGCGGLSNDYRHGYEQAFVDISQGASGETPALAPIDYWQDHDRSACGHQQAQEWFAGYTVGASRAAALRGPYNEVATSTDSGYRSEFAHSLAPENCQ